MKRLTTLIACVGLIATTLALIGGTASAQTPVVRVGTITSDTDNGTYRVSWAARGGCDASYNGSVTGVVTAGAAKLLGSYSVSNDCNYEFTVVFTQPNGGTRCKADASGGTLAAPNVTITVDSSACVTVAAADAIEIGVIGSGDSADAVKATKWTVVASVTGRSSNPDECANKSVETSLDSGDDKQVADFKGLVLTGIDTSKCEYNFGITLKPGFVAESSGSHQLKEWEQGDTINDLKVAVATRNVYVVQTVVGDSAGGFARYTTTTTCSEDASDDFALPPTPGVRSSGFISQAAKTLVPLSKGRFDVTSALAGADTTGSRAVLKKAAIDDKGYPCVLGVSAALEQTTSCALDATSRTVNLTTASAQSIVEFRITCTAPIATTTTTAAPPPPPPPPPTTIARPATTTTIYREMSPVDNVEDSFTSATAAPTTTTSQTIRRGPRADFATG